MNRESLADRLVNYADAVAAFAVVNGLAFVVAITDADVRCSLIEVRSLVVGGQLAFSALVVCAVFLLRRLELRVRSAAEPLSSDVQSFLRGFFITRLAVVGFATAFTIGAAAMALSDSGCVGAAA